MNLPERLFSVMRLGLLVCLSVALFTAGAWGAIPTAERTVLVNLYSSTNGASWTTNTNWNGASGTECTWYGVTCNVGETHVTSINLNSNNLSGTLPDISSLTDLQVFGAVNNQLTGTIPSLSGLTNLWYFDVGSNQLTGMIPSLSGLSNLQYFDVDNNQLTGTIPSLSGLTNLQYFDGDSNQLTGAIPLLSGLSNLKIFSVHNNQLSGTIPSLSGLTNLLQFDVDNNQLTGTIPSLSGLTNLLQFDVDNNQLTGTIPSLSGLTDLEYFYVGNNELTGDAPAVPSPDNLLAGNSQLCPNYLNKTSDPAWDAATGTTPWYTKCTDPTAAPVATAVPTMTEWGMIVFALCSGLTSIYYLRRRMRVRGD